MKQDEEEEVLPDGEVIDGLVYTVLLNKGKTSFDINIGTKDQLQSIMVNLTNSFDGKSSSGKF